MYSIAYVVPYFGKFPKGFQFWLLSCKCNPSIDWLIFTDDKTPYDYPENVKVTYWSFDQMKKKVQAVYDFPVLLERPYKLCDFKPAYGEIFADELKGYDFWGHCDIDLVWGNIRKFYTDDVLNQYEKVGFNGHSNLYKNMPKCVLAIEHMLKGKCTIKMFIRSIKGLHLMSREWTISTRHFKFRFIRKLTLQIY